MEKQTPEKIVHVVELDGPRPNIHVVEGTFKNRPMLNLIYLDGYGKPFSFGAGKAKMLLHAIKEVEAFYNQYKGQLDSE